MGRVKKCAECGAKLQTFKLIGSSFTVCLDCTAEAMVLDEETSKREWIEETLNQAGLVPRLRDFTISTWPGPIRYVAVALHWLNVDAPRGTTLFLFGPVGIGKTGLACGLLKMGIENGWRGSFLNTQRHLATMQESFNSSDDGGRSKAWKTPFLVLDDLGAERPTPWALSELSVLVEERYSSKRPTIVTSNFSPDELRERLSETDPLLASRVLSRILEDATVVALVGEDRRLG